MAAPLPPGLEEDTLEIDEKELASLMGTTGITAVPAGNGTAGIGANGAGEPLKLIEGPGLIPETEAKVKLDLSDWVGQDTQSGLIAAESWGDLNLSKELLEGISAKGFIAPSKIQATALPIICPPKSKNMIGQAQNGSGKTATFSLGMLSNINKDLAAPQGMVLCPTRELAMQTLDVVAQLGKFMNITCRTILPAGERLEKGICKDHIIIGTPGRVYDVVKKKILDVSQMKVFVLDEADVMLNQENQMGKDVSNTRKALPSTCQVLFFSATYPDEIREFAKRITPGAAKITVENVNLAVSAIQQMWLECRDENVKYEMLKELYGCLNVGQSIIFVNSRKCGIALAQRMKGDKHSVSLICGTQKTGPEQIDPAKRDEIMLQFRQGVTKVLIATDVLARGIDIQAVTLVINYELPLKWEQGVARDRQEVDGENYLHRVGRTGRFGMKGVAVSLVNQREAILFNQITTRYGITATKIDEDFEVLEDVLKKLR